MNAIVDNAAVSFGRCANEHRQCNGTSSIWQPWRDAMLPKRDHTYIWRYEWQRDVALYPVARALLDKDERTRARSFHFEHDRQAYVMTRAALRALLGWAAARDPQSLKFSYGPDGKPEVADDSRVQFSVSHSGAISLIAILHASSANASIGVDIERKRTIPDAKRIADQFFDQDELRVMTSSLSEDESHSFMRIWVAKEARVKALGVSLSATLDAWRDRGVSLVSRRLPICELDVGADFVAAIAHTVTPREIHQLQFGGLR